MKNTLPTNFKWCATCKNWGGYRRPNSPSNTVVEFDTYEKGLCYITNLETPCNQSCNKWEQQFKR